MSDSTHSPSGCNPGRLYDVTYAGLPLRHPGDNTLALCNGCASHVGLRPLGPTDSGYTCDRCSGRVDLSYSPRAKAMADRLAEKGVIFARQIVSMAIALTPEIEALLARFALDGDLC